MQKDEYTIENVWKEFITYLSVYETQMEWGKSILNAVVERKEMG